MALCWKHSGNTISGNKTFNKHSAFFEKSYQFYVKFRTKLLLYKMNDISHNKHTYVICMYICVHYGVFMCTYLSFWEYLSLIVCHNLCTVLTNKPHTMGNYAGIIILFFIPGVSLMTKYHLMINTKSFLFNQSCITVTLMC